MQTVICKVRNCGFCSQNGFCLNRLTVINEQGICNYVTKPGWDQQIKEPWLFNTYSQTREPDVEQIQAGGNEEENENERECMGETESAH